MNTGVVRVLEVGPAALLAEVDSTAQALHLATWVRAVGLGARDVVPGASTVLLDGVTDVAGARSALRTWTPPTGPSVAEGPLVEVPTSYDGPDLVDVAAAWGTDTAGVAERLASIELVAAFCGFAPGFAYLSGLPVDLHLSRLDTPRSRVPAGSVAVAGEWCGIYPTASPGGWRLLGTTDLVLWDTRRLDPALLVPGTRVRFVPR